MNKNLDVLMAADVNVTRPWFRDRIPGVNKAINAVNWNCELVDIYGLLGEHQYMPTNTKDRRKFLQTSNLAVANELFLNAVLFKNPKVLILSTADNYREFILPSTIEKIRNEGIFVVGTLGDDEFNYPDYRFMLGWFDMFIAYVKPCLDYYEKFDLAKGYYLPNSCFLNGMDFKEHDQTVKYDAILVGSPTANRPEMVKALIDAGLNVAIYGSKKWEEYSFTNGYYLGFVQTENFDDVLRQGKLILAFLEDDLTGNLHMNTKIWEAVRVARLPISTYYECLIGDYKLTDGVDIVMYKNTSDLVEKVKYYASHDTERIQVAERLYARVLEEFDYSLLYEKLFNHLMREVKASSRKHNEKEVTLNNVIDGNVEGVKCFFSKNHHYDNDVINSVKIAQKLIAKGEKIDFIYFDKLESGRRTISRRPFINLSSIFFLNITNHWSSVLLIPYIFFFGKGMHIKQFSVVSKRSTLVGYVNRLIDQVSSTSFGGKLKRHQQLIKKNFLKFRCK